MSSFNNKVVGSQRPSQQPDESGWTQYLEDFSSQQRGHSSYLNDSFGHGSSPSLVSDAASPNKKEIFPTSAFSGEQFPKRLNVKKQRSKKYSCDELEDTASSPVNSPKVSSLEQMDTYHRRTDDRIGNSMGKESRRVFFHQSDESSRKSFDGQNNNYMDLKKKGLCLMPFSVVVNYLS